MTKLKDMSPDGLYDLVVERLDDELEPLLEREANVELLEGLVRDRLGNALLLVNAEAETVAEAIVDRFAQQALIGDVETYIYVGGNDRDDNTSEFPRRQNAFFIALDEDGAVDTTKEIENVGADGFFNYSIWGKTPNPYVSDEFYPGAECDIQIVPRTLERSDGTTYEVYNLNDYRFASDQTDLAAMTIRNYGSTLNAVIEDVTKDEDGQPEAVFEEEVTAWISENIQWQWTIAELVPDDVLPIRHRVRVNKGGNWGWGDPSKESFEPILYFDENEESQLVFSMRADVPIGDMKKEEQKFMRLYVYFYPNRLGQRLIDSPTIEELVSTKAFTTQSPTNQADYIAYEFRERKPNFRIAGQIRSVNRAMQGKRLDVTINAVALVETPKSG